MDGQQSFDQYRMSNELWERLEPLLPQYERSPKGGRPTVSLRSVVDAIFYRMKTGYQWKAIPPSLAPGSTAHEYFQEWVNFGVFDDLWQTALGEYDDRFGLDWTRQSVDGAMIKGPLGCEATGKNRTDRGKLGLDQANLDPAFV